MPYLLTILLLCTASSSWAAGTMQLMFDSPHVDMVYPDVAGDYLVYSQRVNHHYQVMRLNKNNLAHAKDVSEDATRSVIRFGVALENGDIAYVSNRLGHLSPWLALPFHHESFANAIFQHNLLPNHLQASAQGQFWVFDHTFEATRRARISNQHLDSGLHHQLLGQAWRMYHEKYWTFRSAYPATTTGTSNKFKQPKLFWFSKGEPSLHMLGDGFDADISNDGQRVVFVRENNGNFDLWLQNTDGSGLKQLTHNRYADLEPSFSADGKYITFISNRDALGDVQQTHIYTLELATSTLQKMTSGMGVSDGGPAWLDEHTIIFHSNRDPQSPHNNTVDYWSLWTVQLSSSLPKASK